MKIAIVNDNQALCLFIQELIANEYPMLDIHIFHDGASYIEKSNQFEITILDTQLKDTDGIELSKKMKDKTKIILFVTATNERMQEAFGNRVHAFILNDEIDVKMLPAIREAIASINENRLLFSYRTKIIAVDTSDIYCIRIENRKKYLYTKEKSYRLNKQPLFEIYSKLNESFIYINQSCIVNINHIREKSKNKIILDNGKQLLISNKYKKAFKETYLKMIDHQQIISFVDHHKK